MLGYPVPNISTTGEASSPDHVAGETPPYRQPRGKKKDPVKPRTGGIAKPRRARMPRGGRAEDVPTPPSVHRTLEVWHDEKCHTIPIQLLPA